MNTHTDHDLGNGWSVSFEPEGMTIYFQTVGQFTLNAHQTKRLRAMINSGEADAIREHPGSGHVALLLELIGDDKSATLTIGTETIAALKAMNAFVEQMAGFTNPHDSCDIDDELDAFASMVETAKDLVGDLSPELEPDDAERIATLQMPPSDLCVESVS